MLSLRPLARHRAAFSFATHRVRFSLSLAFVFALAFSAPALAAESRQTFDVPAGDASETLKRFAQQAGRQIVYPAHEVRGVATAALKGDFTPREGIDRMLVGTDLVAIFDEKSGTLAVSRPTAQTPPGRRRRRTEAPARPSPVLSAMAPRPIPAPPPPRPPSARSTPTMRRSSSARSRSSGRKTAAIRRSPASAAAV